MESINNDTKKIYLLENVRMFFPIFFLKLYLY